MIILEDFKFYKSLFQKFWIWWPLTVSPCEDVRWIPRDLNRLGVNFLFHNTKFRYQILYFSFSLISVSLKYLKSSAKYFHLYSLNFVILRQSWWSIINLLTLMILPNTIIFFLIILFPNENWLQVYFLTENICNSYL